MNWRRLDWKSIDDIGAHIGNILEQKSEYDFEFACGCDSQFHKRKRKKGFYVTYITAVTIRFITPGQTWKTEAERRARVGHGGCGFFLKENEDVSRHFAIEVRLTSEVGKSIEVAQEIDKIIDPMGHKLYDIHLDLNTDKKHLSNKVLKGCEGWVRGMGYCPVVKPNAWVASKIADKKTK